MGRRLVIFADGTGNAFSTQESNIWRLYNALDRSDADQVARYIQGVGTSGLRPYALLDGATGIGVPSNVRELYRFLCWNWRPGDEILMFGFSRGAFTIRTLIGLIHHEGLVPAEIDGRRVSSDEMGRNAKAAWRSYREKSFPARWWQPQIGLVRLLRDAVLGGWRMLRGQSCYNAVAAQTRAQGRDEVRIHYVGLFDTVEAFGVPFDELGTAIGATLWPISFRNQVLSRKVDQARHALALDDDRRTFHPVRFERSDTGCRDIQELWFAGAHSDVGGGYPDGELSLVPLAWIAEGAEQAGVRFDAGVIPRLEEQGSAFGPRHDPRRGGAMFYRYAPRRIEGGPQWGGPPVVHGAVARRMRDGNDGYAPLTLPVTAHVQGKDGTPAPLAVGRAGLVADPGMLAFAKDAIWWRGALYFVQLALVLVLALLPVTIPWLSDQLAWLAQSAGRVGQMSGEVDRGLSANLESVQRVLGGLVPDYAASWVQAILDHPLLTAFVALLLWLVRRRDQVLRDAARDCARAAWFPAPAMAASAAGSRSLRMARRLRESPAARRVFGPVPKYVLPGLLILAALGGLLVAGSRTMVTYFAASSGAPFCPPPGAEPAPAPLADGAKATRDGFDAAALCWRSGVVVEKGASYTIWIDATKPFFDSTVISGVGGFRVNSLWSVHTLGLPIRRWWNAEWFQPIAGIAGKGGSEWPLLSLDRTEVPTVDRDRHGAPRPADAAAAVPGLTPRFDDKGRMDEDSAGKAAKALDQRLDQRLVARFTAQATGELYLYLNDAIYWLPTGGRSGVRTCFYENNRGQASVTIRKEALPRPDRP
jgi:hypothetical protein